MIARNIALEVHLINDLLDVTRIVNGKLDLRRERIDVASVLREVAQIVASDLDAHSQTLTIEASDGPYWVEADRARMHQVFWNLFKNAIRFSPPRAQIRVTVAVCGKVVRIDVRDQGKGIAPADLPRLFRAFEQGETTRSFGGLGLGLAISKGIVDLHGGTISAHSDGDGMGATLIVELPLLTSVGDERPAHPNPSANRDEPSNEKPLRILLVEDHHDTAKIVARLLRAEGHEVTHAGCVAEALAAADAAPFDVLMSDLGLPDGSGYDLMRALHAAGKKPRGIAVSGYGSPADVENSLRAGFAEHITKPISFDSLHRAIIRIAGGVKAADPVQAL